MVDYNFVIDNGTSKQERRESPILANKILCNILATYVHIFQSGAVKEGEIELLERERAR